ncbi:MAG: RNA-binding domain-containing protein [Pseudomonadota bacterium]
MAKPQFLIVEDDPRTALTIKDILCDGFPSATIEVTDTNGHAMEILNVFAPDLITTDFLRPGGTGLEFVASLRQSTDARLRRTPVLAISGSIGSDPKRFPEARDLELRFFRAGAQKVLPKPFHVQDFLDSVNELLPLDVHPDFALLHLKRKSESIDYKEPIDLSDKDNVASLAKDVIAMANIGGGTIVVGVAEESPGKFIDVGVESELLSYFEVSRLNRSLRSYLDPPVSVRVRHIRDAGKAFIILDVPSAEEVPLLAARSNERAFLYTGRLYMRNTACEISEVKSSIELRSLLDRFQKNRGSTS